MSKGPQAPASRKRSKVRLLLLPLASLLVLELMGQLLLAVKPEWLRPPAHWARADALAGLPWVDAYFREWWQSYQVDWQSYTYWRRRPFAGDYINVDDQGIRRTWQATTTEGGDTGIPRIFMFGGSTQWGFGARDSFTIPSCLARALADEGGPPAEVVNLGETGYVSTQEVIALMRRIHQGDIPDLVVFYDGNNDVYSTYQAQRAGLPQNEHRRRKEFNLLADNSGRTGYLVAAAGYHLLKRSALVRWTESLARMAGPPALPGSNAPALPDDENAALAQDTAAIYLANVRMLRALSDQFGFGLVCFWQPTLFTKTHRTEYEAAQAEAFGYLAELHRLTSQAVRAGCQGPLQDTVVFIEDVFDDTRDPVYLDFCHVSEAGNEQIARAMLPEVGARLSRPPATPGGP